MNSYSVSYRQSSEQLVGVTGMQFLMWKLTRSCRFQHSEFACQLFHGMEVAYKGRLERRNKLGLRGVCASGQKTWLKPLFTQRSKRSVLRGGYSSISWCPMISSTLSFQIHSVQSNKHSSSFWGQSLESLDTIAKNGELLLQASGPIVPCYHFFSLDTSFNSFIRKGFPS